MELIDPSLKREEKKRPRFRMERNLKVCVFQVDGEHPVPCRVDPRIDATVSIWNFVTMTNTFNVDKSMMGL